MKRLLMISLVVLTVSTSALARTPAKKIYDICWGTYFGQNGPKTDEQKCLDYLIPFLEGYAWSEFYLKEQKALPEGYKLFCVKFLNPMTARWAYIEFIDKHPSIIDDSSEAGDVLLAALQYKYPCRGEGR